MRLTHVVVWLQDFLQEADGALERLDPIVELADQVSLVLMDEQVATDTLLGQHPVDLLRLDERDARVVRTVLDEQRRANRIDVCDRRCLDEEVAIVFERPVLRRQGAVFSRNVTKLAIPTDSTPAAQRSG